MSENGNSKYSPGDRLRARSALNRARMRPPPCQFGRTGVEWIRVAPQRTLFPQRLHLSGAPLSPSPAELRSLPPSPQTLEYHLWRTLIPLVLASRSRRRPCGAHRELQVFDASLDRHRITHRADTRCSAPQSRLGRVPSPTTLRRVTTSATHRTSAPGTHLYSPDVLVSYEG